VFGAQTNGMRSRFLSEIPDELLDEAGQLRSAPFGQRPGGFRAAVGVTGVATASAADRAESGEWAASQMPEAPVLEAFRMGEDVIHAAFGEGVVTGVEPDGVIVVRFALDGSERKLMAEYAPVSRR
jgi:DNA helicase II / ATP-dependent DNA helicase PcrA